MQLITFSLFNNIIKKNNINNMATIAVSTQEGIKYMEVNGAGTLVSPYRPINEVFIQDQFSPIVDRFLTRELSAGSLAANALYNARTLTLAAGHGFTYPLTPANAIEMIEIEYNNTLYQSRVIGVATNVITVTNPIPFAIPSGTVIKRTSPDCNVDGSVTPVVFKATPPTGVKWDIKVLSINILDDIAMDDSKFGGLAALTRGTIYRKTNTSQAVNMLTAVDNSCMIRHCDVANPYSDKAPAGQYGFNAKRYFANDGVVVRIGDDFHSMEVVVSDNLTGLYRFWNVIRGHVVE